MDISKITDEDFAKLLKQKAIDGDPVFQHRVGKCYQLGDGIEQNHEEAVKWFRLSADQGYASAQFNLGYAFDFGEGVEQDDAQAVKWYELSAKQEHPLALNNLAVCYEFGDGVTQDYGEAVTLYQRAAEQNCWVALNNLGDMYEHGKGVTQNLEQAKEYYEKALAASDIDNDFWQPATEEEKQEIQKQIDDINASLAELAKKEEAARKAERTEIFISYAHKDMTEIDYIDELRDHLKSLSRTDEIIWRSDRDIKSGEDWDKKIKESIAKAKVAVLMVSAPFFASDYIWKDELRPILEKAEKEGATILWVLVNYCDYKEKGIDPAQAVNKLEKPLTECTSAERAKIYLELTNRIKELFREPK